MMRVGLGQDSHKFSEDSSRKLILGGVEVDGESGLEANSDGDVVIHALCSALEQAVGNEPFSVYADEMCQKGITDSREYLKMALRHIQEKKFVINNIGISIEAKRPKILPIMEKMRESLAAIIEIEKEMIGVNATSGENLTPFGKGEGIQVFVIVSLMKNNENA
jgi:2-C-methyl-D-erythritol 2,4-cyclodiphosphate synthase